MDESLNKAAELIKRELATWPEKEQRCVTVLGALIQLTIDKPEQADEGFTNRELLECVNQEFTYWGDPTEGEVSSKVSREWKKLEQLWVKKQKGIAQRLLSEGIAYLPKPDRNIGGGGGHSTKYFLKLTTLDDRSIDTPADKKFNPGSVEYFEDDIDNLKGVVGFLSQGFLLSDWRKAIFLSFMLLIALCLIGLVFLFTAGISQLESFGQVFRFLSSFAFILIVLWINVGPFYRLIDNRVEVAPWWLQPWSSHDDWLLVFARNQPESPNVIKLVRYTAKCPKCGGLVRIHNAKGSYSNRLVGLCDNSPREHVFSFDHYLRSGKSIF